MEELSKLFNTSLGIWEIIIPLVFSLVASVVAYFMYQVFYGARHIGAGVHRTFLIGGPAITMLFIGIQTSIPLSLGLLGALSFVRFRTPVKDPAEIGFLLLLIAASIGAATGNYLAVLILFVVVFITLGIQWLTRNRNSIFNRSHLILSVDQSAFKGLDTKLNAFLKDKLPGLHLETTSAIDGRISLHFQFQRKPGFDGVAFTEDLNQLAGQNKMEVFIG